MSENIKFALLYGCKLSQISQPGTLRSPMTCMKPYQKYVHEYDVYGTDMVQIWYRYGTDMVQIWYRYGTDMVQIWYRYGTDMVQIWYSI